MSSHLLKIAHIEKDIYSLPLIIDLKRMESIKAALSIGVDLKDDDRFYFDTVAGDIMNIANKEGDILTCAFLLKQLPILHSEIINEFRALVLKQEHPIGAYFALQLNRAINEESNNADFISIILNKGSVELWVESVRNIPQMPVNEIIKNIEGLDKADAKLWSKEMGREAKRKYNETINALYRPIDIDTNASGAVEEVKQEDIK